MLREGSNGLCHCPHGRPMFRAIHRRAIVCKEWNKGSSLTSEASKRGSHIVRRARQRARSRPTVGRFGKTRSVDVCLSHPPCLCPVVLPPIVNGQGSITSCVPLFRGYEHPFVHLSSKLVQLWTARYPPGPPAPRVPFSFRDESSCVCARQGYGQLLLLCS